MDICFAKKHIFPYLHCILIKDSYLWKPEPMEKKYEKYVSLTNLCQPDHIIEGLQIFLVWSLYVVHWKKKCIQFTFLIVGLSIILQLLGNILVIRQADALLDPAYLIAIPLTAKVNRQFTTAMKLGTSPLSIHVGGHFSTDSPCKGTLHHWPSM